MNRNANLLGNSTLHGDLLRKLSEHRDDLLRRALPQLPCR